MGRGGAVATAVVLVMVLMQQSEVSSARRTYIVGDRSGGWDLGVKYDYWVRTKRCRRGDIIVFNYDPMFHDVVRVNRKNYKRCTIPAGATKYQTGKDSFRLRKGTNYFICSIPGHCQNGMKIAVRATY